MKNNNRKIVIIGVGHVGSHCALNIATAGICEEIVFIDIDELKAESHAKDIKDAVYFMNHPVEIRVGDYNDCTDADILIISIGCSRKVGQTRLDMLEGTIKEMKSVTSNIVNSKFAGILITISNPADIVANYARIHTNLPKYRVFGTGTSLDTARLRRTISEITNKDARSIQCFSMGEHGDSSMIPFSSITIGGKPLHEIINVKDYDTILERTRSIGNEIIDGKGSTEFGIAAATTDLCKAILYNEHRILPVSAYLNGEYNKKGYHVGVPAVIGRNGIEEVIEISLNNEEKELFNKSCEVIQKHNEIAKKI